jgi:predicted phage terminase large subunit-like protein
VGAALTQLRPDEKRELLALLAEKERRETDRRKAELEYEAGADKRRQLEGHPSILFERTEKQEEQADAVHGDARHILAYGGSRSGKTFGFCELIAERALQAPGSRHLIARLHNIDVRQAVMLDTWPNMMRRAFPDVAYHVNKADQFVTIGEGSEIWFGGLDDKDRVDKILGKEYATFYVNESSQVAYNTILTIRTRLAQACFRKDGTRLPIKGFYDLNPTGKSHWSHKEFVEKVRPDNGIPIEPGSRAFVVMNPADNPHLSPEYHAELDSLPERQRQRFRDGRYLSEVPGALWPIDRIEALRIDLETLPALKRVVVGVDPSGSDGTGGDSQGIVVAALGVDGHSYVLDDGSVRLSPDGWARQVDQLAGKHDADLIVAEKNYGGAMVETVLRTAAPKRKIVLVSATHRGGKVARAEPVAALYEQGKVHHVGTFADLEDQMSMVTTAGYQGSGSPDRMDALVWALTELMLGPASKGAQWLASLDEHLARKAAQEPFRKYCQYIRNTSLEPLPTARFDEDWDPAGPTIRRQMLDLELVEDKPDGLVLTDHGRTFS